MVQGEELPFEFIRVLVDRNVTLWLSIYPPWSHNEP
jgi:hypothetical protein